MQNSFRFDVKTRWLLLAINALVVYCIVPVRRDAMFDLNAISTWLQFVLFLLTFPLGSFFVLLMHSVTGGFDGFSIAQHFQMWVVAVALGFLQWFYLIPAMMGRKSSEMTALNLSAGGAAPTVASAHAPGVLCADTSNTSDAPPVPQFDDRGRTPIERVLGENQIR